MDGRRSPALRFGDPRVQALAGALSVTLLAVTLHAVTGTTNKSLRALMTGLLGQPYSISRASYDLTRLRRNGLIERRTMPRSSFAPAAFAPGHAPAPVVRPVPGTQCPAARYPSARRGPCQP